MAKTILVTGGAGYIGSTAVKTLLDKGFAVVVIDNLSKGRKALVDSRARFYQLDTTDATIASVFKTHRIDAVIHFAAYKAVEESMSNAVKYSDNISGLINVLRCMVTTGVKRIIFSSSAAVYGTPAYSPVDEEHPTNPINYYGFTKLECERILQWYSRIHGIQHVALRYFNVAGDGGLSYVDPDAKNIFPIIMEVLEGTRDKLTIFGDDYDTPDGTCVRDYVDVNDLVDAHIAALDAGSGSINIGTGTGYSVKELVDAFESVSGRRIPCSVGPARAGDPAQLVASNAKAKTILGWRPTRSLKDMILSTLRAYKAA